MEMKMKRKRRLMMGVQRKGDVIVTLIWGSLGVCTTFHILIHRELVH